MTALATELAKAAREDVPNVRAPEPSALPQCVFIAKSAQAEQRYVLGVAYPAGWRESIVKGLDGGRDYMSADEVEKAAWWFARNGGTVGLAHIGYTPGQPSNYEVSTGHADVVESYVYRGPDWTVTDTLGNTQVIKSGDWLIGAVLDEPTWEAYKSGAYSGWSVFGTANRRAPSVKES